MHPEAYDGFNRMLVQAWDRLTDMTGARPFQILDIGGQHINGSVHDWFPPQDQITTLDLENADIIADATTWEPTGQWDLVICTEVFEHVREWWRILETAHKALTPGGVLIFTCASTHRPPHGATGAPLPAPGEWYRNVAPHDLNDALQRAGFCDVHVEYKHPPGDAYGYGIA